MYLLLKSMVTPLLLLEHELDHLVYHTAVAQQSSTY
jgi:hypothetical protein